MYVTFSYVACTVFLLSVSVTAGPGVAMPSLIRIERTRANCWLYVNCNNFGKNETAGNRAFSDDRDLPSRSDTARRIRRYRLESHGHAARFREKNCVSMALFASASYCKYCIRCIVNAVRSDSIVLCSDSFGHPHLSRRLPQSDVRRTSSKRQATFYSKG